jgi:SMODS-associating 2TM, beta-strand rich effector domain
MLRNVREEWFYSAIAVTVLGAALAKYLWLTARGGTFTWDLKGLWDLSETGALGLTAFVFVFSKWLWKIDLLRQIGFVKYPNLSGTWKGQWESARTGETLPVNCTIEQDAWDLSWKTWQPKSENISFVAQFTGYEKTQDLKLAIVYRNEPDQGVIAEFGAAHTGVCLLSVQPISEENAPKSSCPWKLTGDYMTNKRIQGVSGTTGSLRLNFHSRSKIPGKPSGVATKLEHTPDPVAK